ncbi:MAG: TraR/DksA C4-type zinc finger protein [Candidatus Hydrogenedentes bacterium]|nr:TraR/DksA C4-type zinc finger protein [Candidatus Hydrogenedentota bacterium]
MNKRDLKKFEKLLRAERERLTGSIKNIEDASRYESGRDNSGDLSSYAESGTDNFELETALNIASGESNWLSEVTEALGRVQDGTFGKCEGCEADIPRKRLEAFPSAKFCIVCQEDIEKQNAY